MFIVIYDENKVEWLRKQYPKGTMVCLEHMDEAGMNSGLRGRVTFVDDARQIHVQWENGRSLALIYGVDSFHKTGEIRKARGKEPQR